MDFAGARDVWIASTSDAGWFVAGYMSGGLVVFRENHTWENDIPIKFFGSEEEAIAFIKGEPRKKKILIHCPLY